MDPMDLMDPIDSMDPMDSMDPIDPMDPMKTMDLTIKDSELQKRRSTKLRIFAKMKNHRKRKFKLCVSLLRKIKLIASISQFSVETSAFCHHSSADRKCRIHESHKRIIENSNV